MNNTQSNIDNLTRLWKAAGKAFQSYSENEFFCYSHIKDTEWPNRIWANEPLSEKTIRKIKRKMEKETGVTYSYFRENEKRNPLLIPAHFSPKWQQYGMSLPLTNKFETQNPIDFKKVSDRTDAEIWSKAFYQAFNYTISTETVLRTKDDIQYYIPYHEKEPIGTIALFIRNKVAGIHSLGILPAKRRQGFANEIMCQILNIAIDQDLVLATLQASEMAKDMYLKMGFSLDFLMENFQLKY